MTRSSRLLCPIAVSAVVCLAAVAAAQSGAFRLPDGDGRDLVLELCGGCHDVPTAVNKRRARADWDKVIEDMQARNAPGSDEEMRTIARYLTRHFGVVNVNEADAQEIQAVLGVDVRTADAIVSYRRDHGEFKTLDELKQVEGVDAQVIDREKDSIILRQPVIPARVCRETVSRRLFGARFSVSV
jgi:competence protein ComEA